jgi:hypothetical protein
MQLLHWQSDALTTRLDLIRIRLDLIHVTNVNCHRLSLDATSVHTIKAWMCLPSPLFHLLLFYLFAIAHFLITLSTEYA